MKATALFFLLATISSVPSDWDYRPSEILITNAHLWKVNSAEVEKAPLSVNYFKNANVSTHKVDTTMKFLILDQSKVNTQEKAYIRFDFDSEQKTFSINSEKVVQKLRELKVGLPTGELFFLPDVEPKEGFRANKGQNNQWYLLPTTLLANREQEDESATPAEKLPAVQQFAFSDGSLVLNNQQIQLSKITDPILSSALIEWGDPENIQPVRNALYNKGEETDSEELLPGQVYNKHYVKLPLEISIFNSNLGDTDNKEASDEGKLDEIFLIKHRLRTEGSGYLWFKKDVEGKEVLFLLEVPVFNGKDGKFEFQIPAHCFVEQVLTKRIKAVDLQCLLPKNSEFESQSACQNIAVGDDENELRIVGKLPSAELKTDADKPVTFWLKAREDLDSYRIQITPGEDFPVETPADENVYVLDSKTCQSKPLFPQRARVPSGN